MKTTEKGMMRCDICRLIRLPHNSAVETEAGYHKEENHVCLIRHHKTFDDLITAAEAGCDVCQYFQPFIEHAQMRRMESSSHSTEGSERYYREGWDSDRNRNSDMRLGQIQLSMKGIEALKLETEQRPTGCEQLWMTLHHEFEVSKATGHGVDEMSLVALSAGSIDIGHLYSKTICLDNTTGYNAHDIQKLYPALWKYIDYDLSIPHKQEGLEKRPVLEFYQRRDHIFTTAPNIQAREIEEDPSSPNVLALARSWLEDCMNTHKTCKLKEILAMPTRVIDVESGSNQSSVKLHEVNSIGRDYIRYATLSHCWGPDPGKITKLTQNTLASMRNHIDTSTLSKNFRDAITITRGLGLRYLWIDALCIIQDSEEDWATEATNMGAYYRRSELTISAFASPGASHGILKPRPVFKPSLMVETEMGSLYLRPLLPAAINVLDNEDNDVSLFRGVIPEQPLNQRAWTLQERLFSRRILHFTRDQMVWQCRTRILAEGGQYSVRNNDSPKSQANVIDIMNYGKRILKGGKAGEPTVRSTNWYKLVIEFMERDLTYDSDRLPAISALAQEVHRLTKASYCAGLWLAKYPTFLTGLLWIPNRAERRLGAPRWANNSFPSWSWASIDAEVYFEFEESPGALVPQPGLDPLLSDWSTPLATKNPFGAVTSGQLFFEAWIHEYRGPSYYKSHILPDADFYGSYSESDDSSDDESDSLERDRFVQFDIETSSSPWFHESKNPQVPYKSLVIMFLCSTNCRPGSHMLHACQWFLVLKRRDSDSDEHEFERVGTAHTWDAMMLKIDEAHGWERISLKLV